VVSPFSPVFSWCRFTKGIPPAKNLSGGENIHLFHSFMFLFYRSWFEALDVALSE
jgi:hypothetical protein